MKCHDCNVKVEPQAYPEGECPSCGLTYTLPDENWDHCNNCDNNVHPSVDICIDCHIESD